MIDTFLGIIAPHSCYGCGEIGSVLCDNCTNDISSEPFSRCIMCLKLTAQGAVCRLCSERFHLAGAWCVGERSGTLKTLIDAYKFERTRAAGAVFAALLDAATPLLPPSTVVTAIPTAPSHIRIRGYDHAELIAREFARRRGLRFRRLLERTDSTTQHFSTRRERFRHARQAFRLIGSEEQIFIIDDIVTTGATLQAAVQVLCEGGADAVYAGLVARQPLDEMDDL